MKDKKRILQLLIATAEVLRGELSEPAQEMYLSVLMPYDDEQISKALNDCVRKSRFFPVPADIIEAITGGDKVQALSAWDEVLTSARRGCKKHHDSDIEHAVSLCGGWHKLGQTAESDLHWIKKEFIEAFINSGHMAFRPAIAPTKILADLADKKYITDNTEER